MYSNFFQIPTLHQWESTWRWKTTRPKQPMRLRKRWKRNHTGNYDPASQTTIVNILCLYPVFPMLGWFVYAAAKWRWNLFHLWEEWQQQCESLWWGACRRIRTESEIVNVSNSNSEPHWWFIPLVGHVLCVKAVTELGIIKNNIMTSNLFCRILENARRLFSSLGRGAILQTPFLEIRLWSFLLQFTPGAKLRFSVSFTLTTSCPNLLTFFTICSNASYSPVCSSNLQHISVIPRVRNWQHQTLGLRYTF